MLKSNKIEFLGLIWKRDKNQILGDKQDSKRQVCLWAPRAAQGMDSNTSTYAL